MKILTRLIRRQLLWEAGKWGHCPIYEDQLQRVWPIGEENRKAKIEQFAKDNGFRLAHTNRGFARSLRKTRPNTN